MSNEEFETTIPFQGFYESIHSDCINSSVEDSYNYFQEKGYTQDQIDAQYNQICFKAIHLSYSKAYVNFVSSELGFTSLTFKELESPREYNYMTDRIVCKIGYHDMRRLYVLYAHTKAFKDLVKEQFTARSGFIPFYSACLDEFSKEHDHLDIETLDDLQNYTEVIAIEGKDNFIIHNF